MSGERRSDVYMSTDYLDGVTVYRTRAALDRLDSHEKADGPPR